LKQFRIYVSLCAEVFRLWHSKWVLDFRIWSNLPLDVVPKHIPNCCFQGCSRLSDLTFEPGCDVSVLHSLECFGSHLKTIILESGSKLSDAAVSDLRSKCTVICHKSREYPFDRYCGRQVSFPFVALYGSSQNISKLFPYVLSQKRMRSDRWWRNTLINCFDKFWL
jgi:hypothetical protein